MTPGFHEEQKQRKKPIVNLPLPFYAYLTNTIVYLIIHRMKVTAIIEDDLINNVKIYTRSSTVTQAITIALKDWLDNYKIKELNKKISQNPVFIKNGKKIRKTNRSI